MAPDAVRNCVELFHETKRKPPQLSLPNVLDQLVLEIMADLVESHRYDADDPNDALMIADARRVMMWGGKTLTTSEIDAALDRWQRLNNALVLHDS